MSHEIIFDSVSSFHCLGNKWSWTVWRYFLIILSWRKRCELFIQLKACLFSRWLLFALLFSDRVCMFVSVFVKWGPGVSSLCHMFGLHLHLCVCGSDANLAKVSILRYNNSLLDLQENTFLLIYFSRCSWSYCEWLISSRYFSAGFPKLGFVSWWKSNS